MTAIWTNRLRLAVGAALAVAVVALAFTTRPAAVRAEDGSGSAASPHYTVVMTEAHNLLVTDNGANKLYFYTIDKDKPIGSPLKLRASITLTDVGKDEIKITPYNLEK